MKICVEGATFIINNNSKTMFMLLSLWQSHCESSPGSLDECRTAINGRRAKTKPDDLGCESACTGCQKLHPPSPFIIITQPESWYSSSADDEYQLLMTSCSAWSRDCWKETGRPLDCCCSHQSVASPFLCLCLGLTVDIFSTFCGVFLLLFTVLS